MINIRGVKTQAKHKISGRDGANAFIAIVKLGISNIVQQGTKLYHKQVGLWFSFSNFQGVFSIHALCETSHAHPRHFSG